MTKRMLIDDTHAEETRVVVLDGNKLEDVEFESSSRKQIKGNIYLAKVVRIEPSLQAAFVDYGGNRHGFLAFGEIHPDYYNIPKNEMAEIEKEVDDVIEAKKQNIKDREIERERQKEARAAAIKSAEEKKERKEKEEAQTETNIVSEEKTEIVKETSNETKENNKDKRTKKKNSRRSGNRTAATPQKEKTVKTEEINEEAVNNSSSKNVDESTTEDKNNNSKAKKQNNNLKTKELKVLTENSGTKDDSISENVNTKNNKKYDEEYDSDDLDDDDDDTDQNFELQRKLMILRKLFHRSKIQNVIEEGQIMLVQVAKEERGNKGAALTTYLSLAGRYCVLMPNRVKSGGVSRKITNAGDRKRLKTILKELPLNNDMSMIVRTAGEDKTKADITRDYNYLVRSWDKIKFDSLKGRAPQLIHEEANLIKRALRDMYTKDISEVIVDGAEAYKAARDFIKILSPQSLKKIKTCRKDEAPIFQRFQIEGQLDKLHETTVQLESGGYLVINPTEALVAIDVNSGRATKEKDLEETALKTNLEAADEIARQLRLRNLAGLVVIDFIDMDDNSNNNAVEKRMKEALKKDRSRVQVGKMSCFGLIEISRQRMHPSFFETSYEVCPHCMGKGMIRTVESFAISILREIEAEGIKNRYSGLNVFLPTNIAIYLLNQKRAVLSSLEEKYNLNIIISADDSIKNMSNFKIERIKNQKENSNNKNDINHDEHDKVNSNDDNEEIYWENESKENKNNNNNNGNNSNNNTENHYKKNNKRRDNRQNGHNHRNHYDNRRRFDRNDNEQKNDRVDSSSDDKKEKSSWWKKLIGG